MIVIGELINTSRKSIREAVDKKDVAYIQKVVKDQEEAGASYIDVNCGTLIELEIPTMEWLVELVEEVTKLPLCIDSPDPAALEAGLAKSKNPGPMINSTNGETVRYNAVLPLIKKYNAKVIALSVDDEGLPKTNEDRIRISSTIITNLTKDGVPVENIFIDPIIKPISAGEKHGLEIMEAVRKIMGDFPGVHMTCGLSNVSYSLPARRTLNKTFMIQLAANGMDSFILDPTNRDMRASLIASAALLGQDKYCRKFINGFRQGLFE